MNIDNLIWSSVRTEKSIRHLIWDSVYKSTIYNNHNFGKSFLHNDLYTLTKNVFREYEY